MNVGILLVFLVIGGSYSYWYLSRTKAMVAAWGQSSGYKILEVKRWFWSLPPIGMLLTTSRSQTILHVKVLDMSTHRIRNGYLRLGSYWWGAFDFEAAEVRWQDE
ncbi:MAG: hypothetical protein ABI114_06050 [Rhodanobacter sp.]